MAKKVVAGIGRRGRVSEFENWFCDAGDVRDDDGIMQAEVDWLAAYGVATIAARPGVYGCPHEAGIDHPDGGVCPACPDWAEHDRETIAEA